MNKLVAEVKKKREFLGLSNSIIERVIKECDEGDDKNNVKEARAKLRKFFGVFLTNKVLKGEGENVLKSHISSKYRDYDKFYEKVFSNIKDVESVIDLGCGVNGFSYSYLKDILGNVKYIGIEAVGQLSDKMNKYFEKNKYLAEVFCIDLFDRKKVFSLLKKTESPRVVLMLQIVDALENIKKDYSKIFLNELMGVLNRDDIVVISMPMTSLSGRKKMDVEMIWLRNFLCDNFELFDEFVISNVVLHGSKYKDLQVGERVFRIRKK